MQRVPFETERIGAKNAMPQIFWSCYFIKAQGFTINNSVLFQDNLCAMLLEQNRMASRSKRTSHIRVIYYFIKYRISIGDVVVKHSPTEEMLADHFTKPLQGKLFRKIQGENTRDIHHNI